MKKFMLLAAALLVGVAACVKKTEPEPEPEDPKPVGQKIELTTSFADSTDVTSSNTAGRAILWSPDDSLNVFYDQSAAKFGNTAKEPSEVALFTSDSDIIFYEGAGKYIWGVYPYSKSNSFDGKSVSLTVPSTQLAAAGTFASGSFPAVGRSANMTMGFRYVCGGLKFKLERNDIERIELRGNSGETLAGRAAVAFDSDGYPVVESIPGASQSIVLQAPSGSAFQAGTYYYLSVLPGTFPEGFTLKFYTAKVEGKRSFADAVTIRRNEVEDLGVADQGADFPEEKIVTIKQIDALERELAGVKTPEYTDTLAVARGEAASVEFAVLASRGSFTDLKAEIVYFNAEGRKEAGFAVNPKLYWARSVRAGGGWDQWAGGQPSDEVRASDNMYPDPLWPVEDCGENWMPKLTKNSAATLWCDIEIPHGIPAGVYSGLVHLEVSGTLGVQTAEKEFAIRVYDVDLPEDQGLYVINWNDGDWWYMNGGKYPGLETVQGYIDQTVTLMNDYGQNVWRVDDHRVDNIPASLDADGNMVFDFSGFVAEAQHFIDLCPKMKMIHGRAFAETYPEDLGVNAWYVEGGQLKQEILYSGDSRVQTFLEEYARQLGEELKKHTLYNGRTWLESFAQSIRDEPEGEYIPAAWSRIASAMKKGCPELKFVEAIQTDCIDRTLIDYPCPTMNHLDEQRAQEGQTQWLYVCVQPQGNYANRFIRLPLLKERYIYWCHFKYNAPGGLHWGLRYWLDKENPYAEGFDLHRTFPAGDYCILYPGYKKVYPSIRACALRDGIRDYDLLKMVEAKNPAKAQEFLGTVVRDADDMDTNTALFRSVRKQMLEYLSK